MNLITFDDEVRRQLESRTPAVSLLPNLHTIFAGTNDPPLSSLLLTPRVHQLKLTTTPSQVAALSSLALEIPLRSPNLRSLHLVETVYCHVSDKAQFTRALVELLKTLQLEEFICKWFPLSQNMLNALLDMPELSTVAIYTAMPDLVQVMHTHPVREAQIRNFSLRVPLLMPFSWPHIISSLYTSKLEALSIISCCGSCDATEFTALISTLVNTCSPEHLADISIGSRCMAGAVIDFKMLKPLLEFVHLRLISLPDHPFDLTDVEIKDMAMAWPNLEELSYWKYEYMSPEGLITIVPKTSLRGLLWLATHCRKLHSLTFPFHACCGAVEDLTENEMVLGESHNLSLFNVGFSKIECVECAEEIAKFIKRVFPNLTLLAFRHGWPNTKQWEKVEELMKFS